MPLLTEHYRSLFLISILFALTACEEENITRLTAKGEFQPATLDFGEVSVGMSKVMVTSLRNTGAVAFTIDADPEIPMNFSIQGLKDSLKGRTLQAGGELELQVAYSANQEGERTGELVVRSGNAKMTLNLRAVGVIRAMPILAIQPAALDFGAVEIGGSGQGVFTISNAGNGPGTITRATLESTGNDVQQGDEYMLSRGLPVTVQPNTSETFGLIFSPQQEGRRLDKMILAAGDHAPLSLTLNGEGTVPMGEILCSPSRVDFGPVERGQTAQQQVVCTARGGPARLITTRLDPGSTLFILHNAPSTMDLVPDQSVTIPIEFRPDGLPDTHTTVMKLDYNGGQGQGTAEVPISGEVLPPPPTETAITAVLEWNTNGTDVDLHLVRPIGIPFGLMGDCYYMNENPDWGSSSVTSDDPFLDVDDVDGYGPETINLEETAAGAYDVYIHYYSDHNNGPTNATVAIHIAGQLAGTYSQNNLQCDALWHVGTVNWNGTNGTFSPAGSISTAYEGDCN